MKSFFRLNSRKLIGHAMSAIEPLMPRQYVYAMHTRDLRNVTPSSWLFDNEGNRIAGRFASSDLTNGFPSPVIWAFFPQIVILSIVSSVVLFLTAILGIYVPAASYSATYMSIGSGIGGSILKAALDVYLGMISISAIALIPFLFLAYFSYILVAETEPTRRVHHGYWLIIILFCAVVVAIPGLGPAAAGLVTLFLPGALFWVRLNGMELARHYALRDASESAKGLTGLPDAGLHEAGRKRQAHNALERDIMPDGRPAPLCVYGVEEGWVRRETGYALSPDKGSVVGQSLWNDLSTHLFLWGNIGSGKTETFKRVAEQWFRPDVGGMLVIDGKEGSLPITLHKAGCVEYLVWPGRGDKINLLAGLTPMAAAKQFERVSSGSEKASIWDKATSMYIASLLTLIHLAERNQVPDVHYTIGCLDALWSNDQLRTEFLVYLSTNLEAQICSKQSWKLAHQQWATSFPELHAEAQSSIKFTGNAWLRDITANEEIGDQISSNGIDIPELVCSGKSVGVVLSEKEGNAGRLALKLIKAAVFGRIKARGQMGNYLETTNERPVMLINDECPPTIDEEDEKAASQLRSLGLRMVYAAQNYDQIVVKLGGESNANAFLDSFKSMLTLASSGSGDAKLAAGTQQYMSMRIGSAWRLDKNNTEISAVALDKSTEKTRASGLEDKRSGALGDLFSSVTTAIAEARRSLSLDPQSLAERKDKMRLMSTESYQLRHMEIVTPNEIDTFTKGQFRAMGVLMRGGEPRVVSLDMTPGIEKEPDLRAITFMQQRITQTKRLQAVKTSIGTPKSNIRNVA